MSSFLYACRDEAKAACSACRESCTTYCVYYVDENPNKRTWEAEGGNMEGGRRNSKKRDG